MGALAVPIKNDYSNSLPGSGRSLLPEQSAPCKLNLQCGITIKQQSGSDPMNPGKMEAFLRSIPECAYDDFVSDAKFGMLVTLAAFLISRLV